MKFWKILALQRVSKGKMMKRFLRWFNAAIIALLLVSCSSSSGGGGLPFLPAATATLPEPSVSVTHAPDARAAMDAFLNAWVIEDYDKMYAMLDEASRAAISEEDFSARYRDAMDTMSLSGMDYEILSSVLHPQSAEVSYRVAFHTVLAGEQTRDFTAEMTLENGEWHLNWNDGLVLPELKGGNRLAMDYRIPARGDIYDRNGLPFVSQADAVAFGIVPGQINDDDAFRVFSELSKATGLSVGEIQARYENAAPGWYVAIGEATAEDAQRLLSMDLPGVYATPYQSRFYFEGGLAAQTIGYTITVPAEELESYRRRGYSGSEKVGYAGLEKWGEPYLAGRHGGTLYVVNPDGQVIAQLGQSDPHPASSIYLTLDRDLQKYADEAIQGFQGAVVVMEVDTGRILAMASSPTFDPNLFEPTNPNNTLLPELLNDPYQPLVNRATQGQYPLGSVFKIITMSAALSSGLYTPDTHYNCTYDFTELPDRILHDWTWEHCQDEIKASYQTDEPITQDECHTKPSGDLTLIEGLMRSCNPYFWHIGLDLYGSGRVSDIANMARAFGLGSPTGIEQVAEASGQILDPTTALEAVNQAIGQGSVLVTPLQVVDFIAAIANGGTLYRPQLIEKIQPVEGPPSVVFKPESRGTLPLSQEDLEALQTAMTYVVESPRGTAHYRLRGFRVPVAGKTGTAESGSGKPHAWFAGYTRWDEDEIGLPNIAVVVILENAGEGSDYAAPVFRRVVESYFYGSPQSLYWWESSFGVTKTPTPLGGIPTKTPKK